MGDPEKQRDTLEDAIHGAFGGPPTTEETRKRRVGSEISSLASQTVARASRGPHPTLVDRLDQVAPTEGEGEGEETDRPTLVDPIAPAPTSTDAPPLRPRPKEPSSRK